MKKILKAEYIDDYKIIAEFDNGIERIIDLEFVVSRDERRLFMQLQDRAVFCRIFVNNNTIYWENGASYAACLLWELGKPVLVEECV